MSYSAQNTPAQTVPFSYTTYVVFNLLLENSLKVDRADKSIFDKHLSNRLDTWHPHVWQFDMLSYNVFALLCQFCFCHVHVCRLTYVDNKTKVSSLIVCSIDNKWVWWQCWQLKHNYYFDSHKNQLTCYFRFL